MEAQRKIEQPRSISEALTLSEDLSPKHSVNSVTDVRNPEHGNYGLYGPRPADIKDLLENSEDISSKNNHTSLSPYEQGMIHNLLTQSNRAIK